MNSKSTQNWTTLRHLALVCVVIVGVLSILATGGSSGGGGGGGGVSPAVANLAGTWFGTLQEGNFLPIHSISVTIDGSGNLTQELIDSADTGRTGTISQTSGGIFSFVLSDGTVGGFIVDASVTHAGYLDEFFNFGAVQKSATGLPDSVRTDIVGSWSGPGVAVDSAFNIVQTATSNLTVASDFSFTETNSSSGTTTGGFQTHTPSRGFAAGNFTSSSITGVIEAFLSTGKTFLAVWMCDTTDGSILVGFPGDCSFFIYNLVLP